MAADGHLFTSQVSILSLTVKVRICQLFPVSAGREGVVRVLLDAGADANRTNDKGLTPLCVVLIESF